jgi:hypothetical protein
LQRTHGFVSAGAHFHPPGLASSPTGSAVVFDEYLRVLTVPPESTRRRKGLGKLRFGKGEEMSRSSWDWGSAMVRFR